METRVKKARTSCIERRNTSEDGNPSIHEVVRKLRYVPGWVRASREQWRASEGGSVRVLFGLEV